MGAQLALWSVMRSRPAPSSDLYIARPLKLAAVVAIDGPAALAEFIGVDADVCGKPVIVPFMSGTPQRFLPTLSRRMAAGPPAARRAAIPIAGAFADLMELYIAPARTRAAAIAMILRTA